MHFGPLEPSAYNARIIQIIDMKGKLQGQKTGALSPVDICFAEKNQFLVIRLLNYKNEVQFFTSDNSNGTICQCLRVKLHSS